MTVTIKKIGGSVAVLIPKSLAREMERTEGSALDISNTGDSIVMRKQARRRSRRPVSQIVKKMSPASYRRRQREFADNKRVGKEIW